MSKHHKQIFSALYGFRTSRPNALQIYNASKHNHNHTIPINTHPLNLFTTLLIPFVGIGTGFRFAAIVIINTLVAKGPQTAEE